jgi:hypothetical protein
VFFYRAFAKADLLARLITLFAPFTLVPKNRGVGKDGDNGREAE